MAKNAGPEKLAALQQRLAKLQAMRDEREQRVQAVVASSSSDEKALRVSQVQLESVERTIKTLIGRCVL